MKMLLLTVLLKMLLVGRVVNQETTTVTIEYEREDETTTITVDTKQDDITTVTVDNEPENETTTITVDTDQEKDTPTVTVDIEQDETEEEDLREQCLYKQKRPGFTCDSGECIDRGGVCDKHQDCTDGSDETISCCSSTCMTATMGSVCIPSDGYNYTVTDCRTCSKSGYPGYRCDDGACIYRRKLCDGRSQCKDDSDEKYCAFHLCQTEQGVLVNVPRDMLDKTGDCRRCDYNSEGDGFRCNNARCILGAWKCDGTADCSDGSDETDQLCKPLAGQEEERQPQLGPAVSTNKTETVATMEQISSASGPCPSGWKCIKYSNCSQFDRYVERGGLFADLRCSSDQLSWVCCDPEGKFSGYGPEVTDYDEER